MNFILIGSQGKMGQEVKDYINRFCPADQIVAGVDIFTKNDATTVSDIFEIENDVDAIIDFSTAQNRTKYFQFAKENGMPYGLFSTCVSDDDLQNLKSLSNSIPVLQCNNSSFGVNLLFKLVDIIAKELRGNDCDVAIVEKHHKNKIDVPSGTAKTIENILTQNGRTFQTSALRVGQEKGFHSIEFYFGDEILQISHRANSRQIFANGAVEAMHKLKKMPAGFYTDILSL